MDCTPVLKLCDLDDSTSYTKLGKYFKMNFDKDPEFYIRVPGRVNLIGEHIDYCGFSVLPMAIEQDIIMAVRGSSDGRLTLHNFDSGNYESFSSSVNDLNIDKSRPLWYHYFLCGYRGVAENYKLVHSGLKVTVKGTVPPSAGLSSSSALVCASALATSFASRFIIPKMKMATLCAHSERYIGTEGGGMDQAIGFLAEAGSAKLIEFNPIRSTSIPLPSGVSFVVSNSCVSMNKAASSQFNIRVMECKLAAKVLAKLNGFDWQNISKLSEIPLLLNKDISEMETVIQQTLSPLRYEKSTLCKLLDISNAEFESILSENTKDLAEFRLYQRALHVYSEAARVKKFKEICEADSDDKVENLGQLMNMSHQSCRDLYECSHPILDELVETALRAGALGSRLTGAGWGGCCISMVHSDKEEDFISYMKNNFYEQRAKDNAELDVNSAIFKTQPGRGACIYVN